MVSSSYFTGNLVGTLFAGWVIKRLGFNRSYYLASLIFCCRLRWSGYYTRLLDMAELAFYRRRGLYNDLEWSKAHWCAAVLPAAAVDCWRRTLMVYYIGTVLGQLMVSKLPTDLMSALPWVTGSGAGGDPAADVYTYYEPGRRAA